MAATQAPGFSLGDTINKWLGLGETAEGRALQEQKRSQLEALRNRILQNPKSDFLDNVNALGTLWRQQNGLDLDTSRAKSQISLDTLRGAAPVKMEIDDNTTQNRISEEGARAKGDVTRLQGLTSGYMPVLGKVADTERYAVDKQYAAIADAFARQSKANDDAIAFNRELLDRQSGFKVKDLIGTLLAGASLFV